MGRLRAFAIKGCECWFHTGDHGPHHFHAGVADEWEIRILFMREPVTYQVKFMISRIPGPMLRRLLQQATEHRAKLLEEWERHVAHD